MESITTSSRLFVKNLPNGCTEGKLKEILSEKGRVTDVQLKFDQHGKFRHFGFVGFKTAEEAEAARQYFHNTFIGASKISIEECRKLSDYVPPARRNKVERTSANSEPLGVGKQVNQSQKSSEKVEKPVKKRKGEVEKPEVEEFIELHQKKRQKVQSDDQGTEEIDDSSASVDEEEPNKIEEKSDMEFLKSKKASATSKTPQEGKYGRLFEIKVRNLPYKVKKKEIKHFFAPLKPKSMRRPPGIKGIAYVGFSTEKELKQAMVKHRSFIGNNRIHLTRFIRKDDSTGLDDSGWSGLWKQKEDELRKTTDTIGESGRIFIRNLSYETTEGEIEELFGKFGTLTETMMPINKTTRRSMGIAFVSFMFPEEAEKAYQELDGSSFQVRRHGHIA